MHYTHLGRSGLRVSRLCLGTMNFGPFTSEADAFAIMDRAVEQGVNFFDTADVYGRQRGEGVTENIIGRWLAQGGGRRDFVVLATKVFGMMDRPARPDPNLDRGLSARKIMRECEASLRRLQTDHLDLYQMHHVDRACPIDEWLGAMQTLQRQGKIYYVGSSNFAGWDLATACTTADLRQQPRLVSEQSLYNLTARTLELEVIPACTHFGVGLIPWSPLGGGLLGGALAKAASGRRAAPDFQKQIEARRPQLERYETLCRTLDLPPADVALAWLLAQPAVTAPIIGPRTMAQLTDALRALDVTLSPDTLRQLDEIFPGPGGPAPEAYAW
ncbi:aldo/keto reductase [Horticoccus luteus]|uniref:Aldo/keto reductase n=1 Tax=Horticoccus luteus TaxID=2862869 RepID=A0A8F9XLR2_9BACT|nr:aldo/keto reductase [Horticoccus luteus]QYM79284.1 aldo/keto reductase [Horticoccus luteus]